MNTPVHRRLRLVACRLGTGTATVTPWGEREAYVGEALALRARLALRLDDLQRRMATFHTFDDPDAGETADRIAAVALAIEELDALIREATAAASG